MAEDRLASIAEAIADGRPVDWAEAEAAATESERARVRHFKTVASLAAAARPVEPLPRPAEHRLVSFTFTLVLIVAAVKVAFGTGAAITSAVIDGALSRSVWPHVACLATFGIAAVVLTQAGSGDQRARSLGRLFLVIASAFADRLVGLADRWPELERLTTLLTHTAADAFLSYALWRFVSAFPNTATNPVHLRVSRRFTAVAFAVGVALALVNLGLLYGPTQHAALLVFGDRLEPTRSWYWVVLFSVGAPALLFLLWRSRFDSREERRRSGFLTGALVVGFTPILVVVLGSPFTPFIEDPTHRPAFGVVVYLFLLSIVPATAYAVLVHRVMDLKPLIRRATRYAAARKAVLLLSAVPLAYLCLYVVMRRHETVYVLVSTLVLSPLAPVLGLGLVLFAARQRLLRAIDRLFLRSSPDFPRIIAALDGELRKARGVRDISTTLAREVERALHPRRVAVLLLDEKAERFVSVEEDTPSLSARSTLGRLLIASAQVIRVAGDERSPLFDLLPPDDRAWLVESAVQLLVPLVWWGQRPTGVLALTERRTELPYDAEDQVVLSLMAGHAAIVVENWRLSDQRHGRGRDAVRFNADEPGDWSDEPAALCSACKAVLPSLTRLCRCGGGTSTAALPQFLHGKFHVNRLIGTGGMGVVYEAVDVVLDRRVALKAVARLAPERVAVLQREARAMAMLQHPNLALIHGTERWRSTLILVMEYLDGGTLADRLRRRPLLPAEAIDLAVALADVLERLHLSGVLHRDVKPSNVGFTKDGVPKLLDFGLADIGTEARAAAATDRVAAGAENEWSQHLAGTLTYLSPEAFAGFPPDPLVDLWSLAVLLYEALAGRNPFAAASAHAVVQRVRQSAPPDVRTYAVDCPSAVAEFLGRALARDPRARPSTAAEFRETCQRLRATIQARY
ncbi:MAG TPA: protein kinase [Vicinamibacterales bacterium]|jgi:hypothetical protein